VLQREILILELVSVDALSTGSVVFGEVSALAHEFRDDAMERAVLVSKALLTSAQGTEVLCAFSKYKSIFQNSQTFKRKSGTLAADHLVPGRSRNQD